MFEGTVATVVFAVLFSLLYYRRIRRNFGRQKLKVTRLGVRVGLLSVLGGFLVLSPFTPLAVLLTGLTVGFGLGVYSARLTTFEQRPDAIYYTPNSYIGGLVVSLMLGRLIWRVIRVSGAVSLAGLPEPGIAPGLDTVGFFRSPLTWGILLVLVAYYVTFYAGLLLRARTLRLDTGT